MKPTPKGWPRISSSIFYEDPARAIDWLCKAFGFTVRMKVAGDDGDIVHSELEYGEGLVMVGSAKRAPNRRSPRQLGGSFTQSLFTYVDDVEAHHKRATENGARIVRALETTDYGPEDWVDRGYSCEDLEGHLWSFAQRITTR